MTGRIAATYILPIRRTRPLEGDGLREYLAWLSGFLELIVVDGSPEATFEEHALAWGHLVRHMRPDRDLRCTNGKVWGVNTGLRHASNDRVVIGDDDVRYDETSLHALVGILDSVDVVRPQNYFSPLPWHARWDTARTLLNRAFGGDWPGTLGVRRDVVHRYDGNVLFENLELWRTVEAVGGRQLVAFDLYVQRRPPQARHFWGQRVRQAYDEFARPRVLAVELAIVPSMALLAWLGGARVAMAAALGAIGVAEYGRRREGGARYFPWTSSLLAPLWLLERGVCSWVAMWERVRRGGVTYSGGILERAANSVDTLRRRHSSSLR